MGKKSVPHITDCNQGENWPIIAFKPDLARFNMTYLEEDHVTLMWKRVVDMAGILGDSVQVEWDGVRLRINSFNDYVRLYIDSPVSDRSGAGFPRLLCCVVSNEHISLLSDRNLSIMVLSF